MSMDKLKMHFLEINVNLNKRWIQKPGQHLSYSFFVRITVFTKFFSKFEISFWKSSHRRCSIKKGVLRNFVKYIGKHLCQSSFFHKIAGLRPANFIKKETLAQVFFCEFCEIFKNTFFIEDFLLKCSIFMPKNTFKKLKY